MKKKRVLIKEENNSFIISLSKVDYDNLKLLQTYLPDLSKSKDNLSDQEKEIIKKYNNFIDYIKQKSKGLSINIDFELKKIKIN